MSDDQRTKVAMVESSSAIRLSDACPMERTATNASWHRASCRTAPTWQGARPPWLGIGLRALQSWPLPCRRADRHPPEALSGAILLRAATAAVSNQRRPERFALEQIYAERPLLGL